MSQFISKWLVGDSQTLILPLIESGTYDFYVDWGDDTRDYITVYNKALHAYANPGEYSVKITGTIKGWRAKDTSDCQLLDICQWGCLKLGNEGAYFEGCKKLQISATDAPDLSETTNLEYMFCLCNEFNSPIGHWDVSHVTKMSWMFNGAESFNQPLDKWDVSKVTDMEFIFCGASSFNQPIGSWNVSSVTDMGFMFKEASSFNQDISSWDVSKVKDMGYMLAEMTAFDDYYWDRIGFNWKFQSPRLLTDIAGAGGDAPSWWYYKHNKSHKV